MKWVVFALMLVASLLVLLPFAWMIISSLKQDSRVFTVPVQWIPDPVQWDNYLRIWTRVPFLSYLGNSLILAVVITALQLLTGSMAAYGFSKIHFPGRNALFVAYISTIAVPWTTYMIPQYIMVRNLHLSNTLWSLILLQAFSAFGVFLMRQYYVSIPDDLCEAARLDGLSEHGIWWRIIMPLTKPALASLGMLTFVNTWNDYMGPFIYLTSNSNWTVQLGLRSLIGMYDSYYALIMCGSVISVLPILVVFIIGQRYFIEGIATQGMKG
jgi:multiple sugar transport system permease protein